MRLNARDYSHNQTNDEFLGIRIYLLKRVVYYQILTQQPPSAYDEMKLRTSMVTVLTYPGVAEMFSFKSNYEYGLDGVSWTRARRARGGHAGKRSADDLPAEASNFTNNQWGLHSSTAGQLLRSTHTSRNCSRLICARNKEEL